VHKVWLHQAADHAQAGDGALERHILALQRVSSLGLAHRGTNAAVATGSAVSLS
jgi:hypothetical protein